jgi:hypothetical protein
MQRKPFLARYPDMRFGYLIELKSIARSEYNDQKLKENRRSRGTVQKICS